MAETMNVKMKQNRNKNDPQGNFFNIEKQCKINGITMVCCFFEMVAITNMLYRRLGNKNFDS